MSDNKPDNMQPAGERRRSTDDRPGVRTKANGWETYSNWLNRIQRSGGRHSAITRNLYSWSNYKSWADKVRNSWEKDK